MADWQLPVRLAYAIPYNSSTGGTSASYTYVRVKVSNLAFNKQVTLHYRDVATWRDFALPWTANYGRYDVFSSPQAPYTEAFTVSYTVGNQTYWDNNNYSDYTLPNLHSAVGGHVMLRRASFALASSSQSIMFGTVYVHYLSFNKRVGVRMAPQFSSNWIDVGARYVAAADEGSPVNLGQVERWDYSTPPINNSGGYQVAAYYQNLDTGEWHWDNNFGQNYTVGSARPLIE
jgi:hypothetical protein